MLATDKEILRELIRAINEGTECYRRAIDGCEYADHRPIFQCMVKSRNAALTYLEPYASLQEGSPEPVHAFGSALYKMYPEILTGLNKHYDGELIRQLERVEEQALQHMQHALLSVSSSLIKSAILDLHPKLVCGPIAVHPYDRAC